MQTNSLASQGAEPAQRPDSERGISEDCRAVIRWYESIISHHRGGWKLEYHPAL